MSYTARVYHTLAGLAHDMRTRQRATAGPGPNLIPPRPPQMTRHYLIEMEVKG